MANTAEENIEFELAVLRIKKEFLDIGVRTYPSEHINNAIPKMSNKKHASTLTTMRALWHNRSKSKACFKILEAALTDAQNEFEPSI